MFKTVVEVEENERGERRSSGQPRRCHLATVIALPKHGLIPMNHKTRHRAKVFQAS